MKHTTCFYVTGLVVLLSILVLAAVPAWAQQIALRSVEPNSAHAGEEVNLAIQGRGFCGPATVGVGEFQARDVQVESDSAISARVFIPEDAEPGPRDVEVVVDCGGPEETFSAVLPEGFTVLKSVGRPTPEPRGEPVDGGDEGGGEDYDNGDGLFDGWLLPIIILVGAGVVVLGGGALAVSLAVRARRAQMQQQMQQQSQQELEQQAKEGDLPGTCQSGEIRVIRDEPELKPGLWKVTGLEVTLYDEARAQRDGERPDRGRDVPEELVKRIDRAARNKLLWGDNERLAAEIAEVGRALAAQVVAWQAIAETGRDIRLEPEIAGGAGSVKFTLYRCVGPPTWWQAVKSWQVKAQAVKHFQQEFRGPTPEESPEAYRAVLEKGLTIYVANLIRGASRLWDTEGVGVSVELSLE
jgi:type II secretory pathway pseudopilin PulG